MKKILLTLSMVCLSLGAFAQADFYPHWYLQIQGGAGETIGETDFAKLISPAGALAVGYQFTPTFSLRANVSGPQGKGAASKTDVYTFNNLMGALDFSFDIRNMFGGWKERVFNPYIFAGLGASYAFNNKAVEAKLPTENYYWDKNSVSYLGRVGLGIDFRVSDLIGIDIEAVGNGMNDKLNSKVGDVFDYQINLLAGLKFKFGVAQKKAAAAAAAAEAAAAKAAAEKAAAEAAARAAAERAAAERAAAERAAAEKAAAERAAAEARAKARALTENVYFVINKWDIRNSESSKIAHIVDIMNKYPEAVVTITGYADKATGTAKRNMFLSQKRAEQVTAKLIEAGISQSRITSEYRGDEVNPYPTPEENRVAVCIVK